MGLWTAFRVCVCVFVCVYVCEAREKLEAPNEHSHCVMRSKTILTTKEDDFSPKRNPDLWRIEARAYDIRMFNKISYKAVYPIQS